MTADPDNPLVMEVLTASSTAYSYYPDVKISEVQSSNLDWGHCVIFLAK